MPTVIDRRRVQELRNAAFNWLKFPGWRNTRSSTSLAR